ncbi:MAG: c-type cytochrome [Candidatus Rokubacteria bacterium]|nr:c-type cytochrome [Candidatus Rokubacteria bacterium]
MMLALSALDAPTGQRKQSAASAAVGMVLLLSSTTLPAWAQQPLPQPFAPEWAMFAGGKVFGEKGCGRCHALRGSGGGIGPDLGRIETGKSFFELGAAMWNHLPRMGAKMREVGIERPILTPGELSNLIAFLFTAQYYDELGDPKAGEKLYAAKRCVQCHEVGGKGGRVGPGLDFLKRANSPVLVAAAMWNHGPEMAEAMQARGIARPTFHGKEMVDLIAYVVASARDGSGETAQVVPGTPERGQKLFGEKRCIVCHEVGGKGGTVGPALGQPRYHVSLTRFVALMWNHGPPMWARMKERGIQVPRLTGQEMADIVAYLYVSHYFDLHTSAGRGRQLVQSKGCLTCHSVRGKGGKIGADFATSKWVGSPAALVAGMWNHSRYMETQTQKQELPWPVLSGQELADIARYLQSLAKPLRP